MSGHAEPQASQAPPDRRPILRGALVATLLCGVLAVVGIVVGSALWETRRSAEERAEEAVVNLALSLERGLARDLMGYDFLLQTLARSSHAASDTSLFVHQLGIWQHLRNGGLGSVMAADTEGTVQRWSDGPATAPSIGLASSIAAHRGDAGLGLHAGEIGIGRFSHEPRMVISRRLEDPDGRFTGIIAASLRLDHIRRAFANFRLGTGGNVTLLTLDGRLVAASVMRDVSVGTDYSHSPVFQRLRDTGPGVFMAPSVIDGRERLFSVMRLEGLPFYLVVGRLTSDIYADWNVRAGTLAALFLGLCGLLGLLTLGLYRELRGRRRAERRAWRHAQEAQAAVTELELVTDNADDLIMKLDWDGTRSFVSPASERLIGYSPAELLNGNATAYVDPADRPALLDILRNLRSGDACIAQVSYRVRHRSGAWRNMEARCRALPDGTGAIVAVRDITERMELEGKLRQAQKMEAVGQLTAGVAHDFNNMLQGQIAGLELLQDRVAGDPAAAKLAGRAIDLAERGAHLTHSLLSFARKQVLRPQAVDVAALLDDLEALLSRTLGPKVTLEVRIEPELRRVLADRAQLEAALLNLCLNARDAMRERGGRILVEAWGEVGDEAGVQGLAGADGPHRGCVTISVADEGCGMAPDILARVCEPFFTTKVHGEGSGLGLSMVQGFAQQSGGALRLESALGEGTRAAIRLPAAPGAAFVGLPVAASPVPRNVSVGRLLLVDDDPGVLDHLGEALEHAGYAVAAVSSGADAVALLEAGASIDVLVTDFGMPGMTGGQLIHLARSLRPGLPALLITGYVDVTLLEGLPRDVAVLHKPFRMEELLRELGRHAALV